MSVDAGILDQVTQQFLQALQHDAVCINQAAKQLFLYLVTIQLSLSALWMTLAGESLQRFIVRMVQLCFSFGFFFGLIQLGGQWIPALLNGFIHIGQTAGVQSLDPSSIIDQGASISSGILKGFFDWGLLSHVFVAMIGSIVCIAILVLYALIAAELAIILVKAYVLVATGGLFFAFGASDYTQKMAINYFQTAIGLGLQLMSLYLLLGVGQHIGSQWSEMTAEAAKQHQLIPMLVILAAVIVYYMILKNVPSFIAGLSGVGGFKNYGDAAVGMAINAGSTSTQLLSKSLNMVGTSVQRMTQAGMTTSSISKLARGSYQVTQGGLRGVGAAVGNSASHVGSAMANTISNMATRQNTHMTIGQKINHHLANRVNGGS